MLVKKRSKFKGENIAKFVVKSDIKDCLWRSVNRKYPYRTYYNDVFNFPNKHQPKFFPLNNIEKLPRFKEAYKSKTIHEILKVNLILLIPIIFGVLWVILSALGILPPLESILF